MVTCLVCHKEIQMRVHMDDVGSNDNILKIFDNPQLTVSGMIKLVLDVIF